MTNAFINYISNFFFISLAITFVLIMFLIYHYKQRISSLEQKFEEMHNLMANVLKEIESMHVQIGRLYTSPATAPAPPLQTIYEMPPRREPSYYDENDEDDEEEDDDDVDDEPPRPVSFLSPEDELLFQKTSTFEYEDIVSPAAAAAVDTIEETPAAVAEDTPEETIEETPVAAAAEETPVAAVAAEETPVAAVAAAEETPVAAAEERIIEETPATEETVVETVIDSTVSSVVPEEDTVQPPVVNPKMAVYHAMNLTELRKVVQQFKPDMNVSKLKKYECYKILSENLS
jgi:hypothetical protein